MLHDQEPQPGPPKEADDGWHRYVVFTVVTAALSTLTTALATWAVDELRARYGTKKPEPDKPATPT